jgi:hypothetical protein
MVWFLSGTVAPILIVNPEATHHAVPLSGICRFRARVERDYAPKLLSRPVIDRPENAPLLSPYN